MKPSMSLYNMVNGVKQATFFILPMLGKHPDEYPRFRDCFIGGLENDEENDQFGIPKKKTTDEKVISVYTRVGGGNRDDYQTQIDELRKMPNYVKDYDDDFDSTFATFVFLVPEKWKTDFDKLTSGKANEISNEYKEELKRVFPKLAEKFDEMFSGK
jgi:hypothetical protein